jgi:hypothetical protein
MHPSAHIGGKRLAFFPVEVAIEFASVEYNLHLRYCFEAGTDIVERKRPHPCLVRHRPKPQRRADQGACVKNDSPNTVHRDSCTSRTTSSSVNAAAASAWAGERLPWACALHSSNSATARLRLRRALSSSSISWAETMNAAGRPCLVMATGSRCAVSSKCPKRFWASTEVMVFIRAPRKLANLDNIAVLPIFQERAAVKS